ncbi:reticulophagy regulator 2 [Orussus abietinus]|uniref:reticulophagy regulator 2 n=1 Tax=Orussus abietinus TaxID=222816 RepID=UPI000626ECAB|nr:reticulophagy regulator 2 [Orussus abietinus]
MERDRAPAVATMERVSEIVRALQWSRGGFDEDVTERNEEAKPCRVECRDLEASRRLYDILEGILLWKNTVNSISVVVVFNLLFWGIVVLEIRGFAAASSAALVVVLCYSTLEAQSRKEDKAPGTPVCRAKTEQIDKIARKAKTALESLKQLRKEQPGAFCVAVCSVSLGLWLIGRAIDGVLLAYTICMSILLGPALLLQIPHRITSPKEWDSEIEEFLPAVTEDNFQVLKRAGESGDNSLTPPGVTPASQIDPFDDEELIGLKMPSHEEGSTDGLELSELELSTGDAEVDGIKFRSGHFERSSSSEEEAELQPEAKKLPSHSEDSDSEFEIIDSREVADDA